MKNEKYLCEGIRGHSYCSGCGAKDVPRGYVKTKTTMRGQCLYANSDHISEATRLVFQQLNPTLRLYIKQED